MAGFIPISSPADPAAIIGPELRADTSAGADDRPGAKAGAKAEDPRDRHFGLLRALDERGNVRSLSELESEMIKLAIEHYQGRMSEVARRLGIGRSTLYRKLQEYGIQHATDRAGPSTLARSPQFPA